MEGERKDGSREKEKKAVNVCEEEEEETKVVV